MYPDTLATENAERHAIKLTKRHLVRLFWVLTVPFLFPSALAAEPSLAETIQYIEAKLSNVPSSGNTSSSDSRTFRLNGGEITCTTTSRWMREVITFQLGALSSTVNVVEEGIRDAEVKISCARGRCISYRYLTKNDDGDYEEWERRMMGGTSFKVHRIDAERIQKALIHAIKISGGKEELF